MVIRMDYLFYNCSSLIKLDLHNFTTVNVRDMRGMFSNCISLVSIYLDNFIIPNTYDSSHYYTNFTYMFYNCSSLISLDLPNFILYMPNMNNMFNFSYSLMNIRIKSGYKTLLNLSIIPQVYSYFHLTPLIYDQYIYPNSYLILTNRNTS